MNLLFPFLIVWAIVAFIMYKGVRRGIEVVCRVTLPILMLLIVLLVIRGIYIAGGSRWTELPFPAGLERIKETKRMGSRLWTDFL